MNPGPPTGNPFPSLKDYTKGHPEGSKDALEFQPDVALRLGAAAEQVIMGIGALKQYVADMTAGSPVSHLGSGTALGRKFGAQAGDLDKILDDHKKILADMIDTFIAAGKAYGDMDGFNAALLDNVSSNPKDIWEMGEHQPPPTTPKPAFSTDPNKKFADINGELLGLGAFHPSTIMGESADGMSWLDLYQVGNSIRLNKSVQTLSDQGGTWRWMAGEVDRVFVDFVNNVDSVTVDQWKGPGREVAVAAVKSYAASVPKLSAAVKGFGDLLTYTSGWLDATQVSMPYSAENPAGTLYASGVSMYSGYVSTNYSVAQDQTPTYRENFRKTYLTGLPQTASHVPVLPPAAGAFGQIPSDPYKPAGGDQGGGGNQGGNQGGGGPGGGSPYQGGAPGGAPDGQQLAAAHQENPATAQWAEEIAQLDSSTTQDGQPVVPGALDPAGQQGGGGGGGGGLPGSLSQLAGMPGQLAGLPGQISQAQLAGEQVGTPEQQIISSAAQQLSAAAQQGLPQLLQTLQQLAQTLSPAQLQEALKRAGLSDIPGLDLSDPAKLDELMAAAGLEGAGVPGGGGGGGGLPGGGGGGIGGGTSQLPNAPQASKLFPRVAALAPITAEGQFEGSRAGLATAGTPGTPGTPGAPAAGAGAGAQGGRGGEHRRPTYLESSEHLEDALGDAPVVVRPVVER